MTDELEPLPDELFKVLDVERARPAPSADQLARLASRLDSTFAAPAAPFTPSGVEGPLAGLAGKAVLLAVGLTVGALGGAQLQQRYGAPREVIVVRRVEVPVRVEVKVPVPVPVEAPLPAVSPVPRAKDPARAPIEPERLLVEQASSALGRGRGSDAIAACVEHQLRFPSGQLAEERESIAIRALVLLGQKEEALARAEAFRISFPESLLIDVVNASVQ